LIISEGDISLKINAPWVIKNTVWKTDGDEEGCYARGRVGALDWVRRVFFIYRVRVVLKIPFEDPLVLNYVRAGCDLVQVIVLAVYYYVSPVVNSLFRAFWCFIERYQMKRKNDQTLLKYGTSLHFTPPVYLSDLPFL
jgi:hypothetical protein